MRGLAKSGPVAFRSGRLALAVVLLCAATGAAEAQGGFFELFGNAFGGDSQGLPQPDWAPDQDRPLTVRRHPRPHRSGSASRGGSQHYDVAALKGVTIYTDKTLARGDAVMTPTGLKVFNGSQSWPHTDDDFVAVAEAGRVSSGIRKELTAIDAASRPALRR